MHNYIMAGIGSRTTPPEVLDQMYEMAVEFACKDWILRSGGADGADTAFEKGYLSVPNSRMTIFTPWDGFNNRPRNDPRYINHINDEAVAIARDHHPLLSRQNLSDLVALYHQNGKASALVKLMTRNVFQILGQDLKSPTTIVVCYAPIVKGVPQGGTAQAIRIANTYGIPVVNLFKE